jgi:hypothetical protein
MFSLDVPIPRNSDTPEGLHVIYTRRVPESTIPLCARAFVIPTKCE